MLQYLLFWVELLILEEIEDREEEMRV